MIQHPVENIQNISWGACVEVTGLSLGCGTEQKCTFFCYNLEWMTNITFPIFNVKLPSIKLKSEIFYGREVHSLGCVSVHTLLKHILLLLVSVLSLLDKSLSAWHIMTWQYFPIFPCKNVPDP